MKQIILAIAFLLMGVGSSFAQFEAGKYYVGAGLQGVGLSYDSTNKFTFGAEADLGYMIERDWLVIADAGLKLSDSTLKNFYVGGKLRYLIEQNGLFLQAGAKFLHEDFGGPDTESYNDFLITPEIGYCFFLNHYVALEPSVYYDMSLGNFSKRSCVGLKIGLACYF